MKTERGNAYRDTLGRSEALEVLRAELAGVEREMEARQQSDTTATALSSHLWKTVALCFPAPRRKTFKQQRGH